MKELAFSLGENVFIKCGMEEAIEGAVPTFVSLK